jgi:hypothetical protein
MFYFARPPYPRFYPDAYPDPYLRLCPTPYPSRYLEPYPSCTRACYPMPYLSLYPSMLPKILPELYPSVLSDALPDYLPGRIILPDLFLTRLLPTRSYPTTIPDFLTLPGNTSLPPTAYPAIPNHLSCPGILQLALPKNFLIDLPP